MSNKLIRGLIILILSGIVTSCSKPVLMYNSVLVKIPENISIRKEELRSLFNKYINAKTVSALEVIVYSYSTGYESLGYSDNNKFYHNFRKGQIALMLKFKRANKIQNVIYIKASGKNKAEIFNNINKELEKIFKTP